jgi:DNA invertase Pin-like site-specific DNA recombinase
MDKRAVIYTRTVEGLNPDVLSLRQYCQEQGWSVVREYHDKTLLGAKDRRKEQDRLLRDAQNREFDVVVVSSLSSWGKSFKHLVDSISLLKAQNISFVSIQDRLDLESQEIFVRTVEAFKSFNKAQKSEKIKMGMMISRLRGLQIGRTPTPKDQLASIIAVFEEDKLSVREIAKKTSIPRSTVHKTLKQYMAGEIDRQGKAVQSKADSNLSC